MREEDPPPLPSSVTMSTLSLLLFSVYLSRRSIHRAETPRQSTLCLVILALYVANVFSFREHRMKRNRQSVFAFQLVLHDHFFSRGWGEKWRKKYMSVSPVAKITRRGNFALRVNSQQHLIYVDFNFLTKFFDLYTGKVGIVLKSM